MSAAAVEPGTRLAGRFRLEDRVSESSGSTLWKAIDEILARPVAVRTFAPGFPRVQQVVTAARAVSRVNDPRLTQVFDAADENGRAYVVTEWVTGENLLDLLANGPLEPDRAATLIGEAAEALASAHRAGLAHLCLKPECLMWSSGGTVKLLGLGVDAALAESIADDPAREDAEGLGRLLYAALTGHWPGKDEAGLPPAPDVDGRLGSPRQVVAGVSGALDAITCRSLLQEARRGRPPLTSPADVAEALSEVPRNVALPVTGQSAPPAVDNTPVTDLLNGTRATMAPTPLLGGPRPPDRPRGPIGRTLISIVVVGALVALGIVAWTLGRTIGSGTEPSPSTSASARAAAVVLKAASATGFDPLGDDKAEHPELAKYAVDGNGSTEWHTTNYNTAELGGLKKGVGLLLDMGRKVNISEVTANFGGSGSSVHLKVGDRPDLEGLPTVAQQDNVAGSTTLKPAGGQASGRYVLIWFTKVPPSPDRFRGTIYDVTVHGPGPA